MYNTFVETFFSGEWVRELSKLYKLRYWWVSQINYSQCSDKAWTLFIIVAPTACRPPLLDLQRHLSDFVKWFLCSKKIAKIRIVELLAWKWKVVDFYNGLFISWSSLNSSDMIIDHCQRNQNIKVTPLVLRSESPCTTEVKRKFKVQSLSTGKWLWSQLITQ